MKKRFAFVVVCVLMILCLTGCGSKEVITTDYFKTTAEKYNYTTLDVSDKFSSGIVAATYAESSDGYGITFLTFEDESSAVARFNYQKSIYEKYKGSASSESSSNVNNYLTYTLTSGGYYMHICKVDNTMLYVRTSDIYKSNVKKMIKELGY